MMTALQLENEPTAHFPFYAHKLIGTLSTALI